MASLFSTAIIAACVSAQGQYNAACTHAVDAGTRQIGIRQNVDKAEDFTVQYVNKEAEKNLGKEVIWVVGTSAFVYRTARDKTLTFRVPSKGIADSITNQISPDRYTMNLNWNF